MKETAERIIQNHFGCSADMIEKIQSDFSYMTINKSGITEVYPEIPCTALIEFIQIEEYEQKWSRKQIAYQVI